MRSLFELDAVQEARAKRTLVVLGVIVALMFAAVYCGFYTGLVSRHYTLPTEKLPAGEDVRIVVLADLHSYTYGKDQQPLIRRIEAMQPDVICMVGDMADWVYPLSGVELLLEGIAELAPCLYVTGNHEYWSDVARYKALFREYGVHVLENEALELTVKGARIFFYGVDDPDYARAGEYGRFFEDMLPRPKDAYTVLLAHRPDPIAVYADYGFDLVLSGHTHGGQVRIPLFVNGLYAPDEGWFPRYAGGEYKVRDTTMIISRGLSYYKQIPRIFNPPEVVCVTLRGAN